MERINQAELSRVSKSNEHLTTSPPSPLSSEEAIQYLRDQGAPQWTIRVLEMAQDKRHDLPPHSLRYWREKLKDIPDQIVCEALLTGRWKLFPSVDDVLIVVEEIRERMAQRAGESDYERYKRNQEYAATHGLLATEEDYAAMRKRLRELFGDPTAKPETQKSV